MNGYFQLDLRKNGTYLRIYKPSEGGAAVDFNELAEYLRRKKIDFDIVKLNRAIENLESDGIIHIDDTERYQEREMFTVGLSEDFMTATVRFYPPSVSGELLSREDIVTELEFAGVKNGLDNSALASFIAKRTYCTDIVIAKGLPVRRGKDASIEYFFQTDLRARPTLNEDGSVDFFHLNTLNHIKEGDLLARLTPADYGTPGIDVRGEKIPPSPVSSKTIKFGHNVRLSEDRLEAYSEVNGHVVLIDDKIFVSNTYEVQNVDNSTGDIVYDGNVSVAGNICSNFTVTAKGDIEVQGVVEGATLNAGGNIIIVRGVNGMGKGVLNAGGNVIVKYIENATVIAGGYVETDSIMHSNVSANSEINVMSKKGFISGSHVSALEGISVKNLGSQMGADTVVELGILPETIENIKQLKQSLEEIQRELNQIKPVLAAQTLKIKQGYKMLPEQKKTFREMADRYGTLTDEFDLELDRLDNLEDMMEASNNAQARVSGVVYAGTKLIFGDISMVVKEDNQYCRFYVDRGEVKCTSYE